jgi:hypothetical protein
VENEFFHTVMTSYRENKTDFQVPFLMPISKSLQVTPFLARRCSTIEQEKRWNVSHEECEQSGHLSAVYSKNRNRWPDVQKSSKRLADVFEMEPRSSRKLNRICADSNSLKGARVASAVAASKRKINSDLSREMGSNLASTVNAEV